MTYKICYWDALSQQQLERDATPAEIAEIDVCRNAMPTLQQYTDAVQAMLDATARAHSYDDLISACSYAGAPNQFQADGIKFLAWRGNVWTKCHDVMNQVQAGTLDQPTVPALLAMLPDLDLPNV